MDISLHYSEVIDRDVEMASIGMSLIAGGRLRILKWGGYCDRYSGRGRSGFDGCIEFRQ